MARNMYGATSADFTLTSGGRVVPGATLTIWSARTGGTQITDLLDKDSVATTTVTSDADGSIVYYGPNNDKTVHWADSGVGNRIAVRPTDITGDPPVLSIGTVGTGAAAASLTGTSEAPVLNLVLPSAGANGVNTAAIQDDAVTAAKIAADAVGSSEIAAGAVGTSEIADAAVTPAKLATSGRFVFPTGAANGYGFTSGASHLSGTGTPEGVVTAAPGSTWLQTDATTDVKGWIRWIKATGTGNTGWQAGAEADTGWRDVSALFAAGFASSNPNASLYVRRVGQTVSVHLKESNAGSATGTVTLSSSIPAAFCPTLAFEAAPTINEYNGLPVLESLYLLYTGTLYGFGWTAIRHQGALTFQTTAAWPSSLPGSAY